MDIKELVKGPRRLTMCPRNTCLLCEKNADIRELWYCNDRLFGNILCYDCCSIEDGEKMQRYWMNMENLIDIRVGEISLVEYMKNLGLSYKVRRSNGTIDNGWNIKWNHFIDDYLYMNNNNVCIMMVKYGEGLEKLVDFVSLLELNIEVVEEIFNCKMELMNWVVIGNERERIFFEDVKNWEKSFSIFMKNINENWDNVWNYYEKIFV